ncbi:MAG: hypothetical protein QOC81_3485 [Thermoanaerobaculia bacterium]|jgi:uncharacterized protein (DUF433 family)|nr:hypothetical protein [Thermoanaerobaculia bacterium]
MSGASRAVDLYQGRDPRELPLYGPRDAAACLNISEKTILNWLTGHEKFKPVLTIEPGQRQLSFYNLCEAFVLNELRRRSRYSLQALRIIDLEIRTEYPQFKYPLADLEVSVLADRVNEHDEVHSPSGKVYLKRQKGRPKPELFTQAGATPLISISTRGRRLVLADVIGTFLQRVDKTPIDGIVRLYPFITKDHHPDAPKSIVLDARVAFGKPVIAGTGIPTASVYQLFNAGDRIQEIADEYSRDTSEIEAAIRYESVRAKRAA